MPDLSPQTAASIRRALDAYSENAYAPYSSRQECALLVLRDGRWMPGVRIESASYSLVIPAVLNAYTSLRTLTAEPPAMLCVNYPLEAADRVYAEAIARGGLDEVDDRIWFLDEPFDTPWNVTPISPYLDAPSPESPAEGVALARAQTANAHAPESDFPVACVLETNEGRLIPGVNVEHSDWSRILCAERNALSTAYTFGNRDASALYLTCLRDPRCTPCGACRQLLAELTPNAVLWMDRSSTQASIQVERATPESLLPAWFNGGILKQGVPE